MPKFTFECPTCNLRFVRTLKADVHESHLCPSCSRKAPRVYSGFAFDFARGSTPGNSGVAKHDYPTADQAVGPDAEKRWEVYDSRDSLKNKVREGGETHALRRRSVDGGLEYQALTAPEREARKVVAKKAVDVLKVTEPKQ